MVGTAPGKAHKWGKDDGGSMFFIAGTIVNET
jgi:hypothetical protein